jgi:hypothetical protein
MPLRWVTGVDLGQALFDQLKDVFLPNNKLRQLTLRETMSL